MCSSMNKTITEIFIKSSIPDLPFYLIRIFYSCPTVLHDFTCNYFTDNETTCHSRVNTSDLSLSYRTFSFGYSIIWVTESFREQSIIAICFQAQSTPKFPSIIPFANSTELRRLARDGWHFFQSSEPACKFFPPIPRIVKRTRTREKNLPRYTCAEYREVLW